MFFSSVKVQFKAMIRKTEFQIAFLVTLFYACAALAFWFFMNAGTDISQMTDANQQIGYSQYHPLWFVFRFLYPFLIVLPFATSYVDDYHNRLLPVYVSRVSRGQYYSSKLMAGFIGTAVMIAVPFLINLLLCNLFFPHNYNTWFGEYQLGNYTGVLLGTSADFEAVSLALPFLKLFLFSPFLYNLVYLIFFSAFSGLLGSFVLALSFVVKRWKILLFFPVYIILQVFQTCEGLSFQAAIHKGTTYVNYNPLNYVVPGYQSGQSMVFFLLFCVVLLAIILLASVYGVKRELKSIQ